MKELRLKRKKRYKMAYLHCHNPQCDFSQDDFWSESYNPMEYLKDWEDVLLDQELDKSFTTCDEFIAENGDISRREVVAREFERGAARIREMKYRTHEEYKEQNPDGICPKCGKKELDID